MIRAHDKIAAELRRILWRQAVLAGGGQDALIARLRAGAKERDLGPPPEGP